MSAEEPKPVVATEPVVVEPIPAPAETLATDKPADAVEPKTEEPAATEGEAAAATAEEKKEKVEEKPVEPITSGALGYKAPGLKNVFRYSKKYFWIGEEAVPTSKLNNYLRGEKPEVAHPTAAWSSQTGKGLLYFVKHEDEKETPAGVLNLSEATDLSKDGLSQFFFKLHGHKHTFEAQTTPERNGWFVAIEKAIEAAQADSEALLASEGYKEQLEKLGKPTPLAASGSTPKKSIDATPKLTEAEASTEAAAAPARTGSASSDSSNDKKKAKSKSRSVSRGKRASIFGGFRGKKEKAEEKKEEKKEESEAKKEEDAVPPVAETAPVIPDTIPTAEVTPKPIEEVIKPEETPAAVEPAAEEAKPVEEKPKPAKRGSIFGNFVEKLKSPTHEKKEHEVVPAPVVKETETPAEAPKVEETPAAPAVPAAEATTEEAPKAEEAKPATTTPHKEKSSFSFGKFLGGAKEKVKSPTTEKTPAEAAKTEEPAKTEEAPVAAVEPAAEAPKEEESKEEAPIGVTATASATPAPKKRGSIFGSLTGSVKKEKDGENDKPKGLGGLFRNASKAGRNKKEKEAAAAPAKVEETAEPKEEAAAEAPKAEEKKDEEPTVAAIGDVVPEAVTVGQAPKSTPEVSATA